MTPQGPELHVFVIRARRESREIPGAPAEWRFWIEHHPGGEQHYYRNFEEVLAFIAEHLPADAMTHGVTRPSR
jgi:hypothetical protein